MTAPEFSPREETTERLDVDALERELSAAEALLVLLEEEGVDCIFGVPGGPLTSLFEAISRRSRIRFVLARHEAGAAFMAAAHTLVTGRLAVVCGTSGPGATNALTGVAVAKTNSLPVLFLSGQVSTASFGTGAIQESSSLGVDVVRLFEPVTKLSVMVPAAERLVPTIRHALRVALGGRRGPVHVSLPANFLGATVKLGPLAPVGYRSSSSVVDPEAVNEIADWLARAARPVFLLGHGVRAAGAEEEILAVARLLGAKIVSTPKAKGCVDEGDPRFAGILGFGGHASADVALGAADLVVVWGSSLNEFVLQGSPLPCPRTTPIVQVDIDPAMIGNRVPVARGIVSDARAFALELAVFLGDRDEAPSGLVRVSSIPPAEGPRSLPPPPVPAGETRVSPREVVRELGRVLEPNDFLFVDIGTATLWALHHHKVRQPGTFFTDLGFGCMGTAVAGAVGAALAFPSRRTVALVGDGAFAMHGFEVHTAVDERLPVTWVVLNNQGHGMVYQGDQLMRGRDLGASRFARGFDAATVARGLGAETFVVRRPEELHGALVAACAVEGPSLVEVHVRLDEEPPTLKARVRGLAEYIGRPAAFQGRDPGA